MIVVAWLGAVLFGAALAGFAYFYAVVLGRPAEAGDASTATAVTVNVTLFTLFALHHSLLARTPAKRMLQRFVPARFERTTYVWVASLLFMAVCWWWQPLPGIAWATPPPLDWVGRAAQLAGVALTLVSARRIDMWELAGVRQALATPQGPPPARPAPRASAASAQSAAEGSASLANGPLSESALEITGPFGWVRHPIYLGWILMVFGTPLMTNGRLLFAAASTGYLVLAIPFEERSLREAFGPAYDDYRRLVRWRLVPGVW